MTLEWMWLLATFQFHFQFPRVEVSQDLVFSFQSNKGGMTVTSVIICESVLISMEKLFLFTDLTFPS
jgi:hypothetical protein